MSLSELLPGQPIANHLLLDLPRVDNWIPVELPLMSVFGNVDDREENRVIVECSMSVQNDLRLGDRWWNSRYSRHP